MPTIINPYVSPGASTLGNTIQTLGQTMFGPGALQAQVLRENAAALARKNTFLPLAADALAKGDTANAIRYSVQAGLGSADAAGYNRLGIVSANPNDLAGNAVTAAEQAAGEPASSTMRGFNTAQAVDLQKAQMAIDRAAQTQQAIAGRELTPVLNPDGTLSYYTKQEAGTGHMAAPITADQAKGFSLAQIFRQTVPGANGAPVAGGGVPANPAPATGTSAAATPTPISAPIATPAVAPQPSTPQPAAAGAVSTDPLSNLPPSTAKLLGVEQQPRPMVNVATHESGISYDGGRSVVVNGQVRPVGAGWIITDPTVAANEARTELTNKQLSQPIALPPWQQGAASRAAYQTTGPLAFGQEEANNLWGVITQGKAGEVGANYERGRTYLANMNQAILTALKASPTAQFSTKEQERILYNLLPDESFLANPITEANRIGTLTTMLATDNARLRGLVIKTPPGTLRDGYMAALDRNENALGLLTRPAQYLNLNQGPAPAVGRAASQPAAPQPSAPMAAQPQPMAPQPARPQSSALSDPLGIR